MAAAPKLAVAMIKKTYIAVVAPVYRGEQFVLELCNRLHATLGQIDGSYSIVLVDDASPDNSWQRIKNEALKDSRVLGVQLSRNFGQHYAITAGLDNVDADWVVVMDGDLQDQPEDILTMHEKAVREAFDIVIAERSLRTDPFFRKMSSAVFNRFLSLLSGLNLSARYGNFRIMNRNAHQAFAQMREHMRFYPAIMQWIGFRSGYAQTSRVARPHGRSSYTLFGLVKLAVQATVAYSERPLHVSIVLGLVISLAAFVLGAYVIAMKLFWDVDVEGWTSLFATVSFLGGLQIFLIGIVGLYIGKTFQESKKRPLYLVRERADGAASTAILPKPVKTVRTPEQSRPARRSVADRKGFKDNR